MFEHQKILDKIEKLVEQLPYRSIRIELELQDQTLVLAKDRQRPIGFDMERKCRANEEDFLSGVMCSIT